MTIWATCKPCADTFPIPDGEVSDLTLARCPRCDEAPAGFEARTDTGEFELSVVGGDGALVDPADRVVWLR